MSRPELPKVDLRQASKRNRASTTLERKWFKIQRQGSLQIITVNIEVEQINNSFSKICTKLKVGPVGGKRLDKLPQNHDY